MVRIPNGFVAALIVAYLAIPHAASAQCAFEHPQKAKKFQTSLVQAFVDCNSFSNTTTEGGVPACKPPETFRELFGMPSNSWEWDELKGQGAIALKATTSVPPSPLNPPANSTDIAIQMKLKGVLQQFAPASGTGSLVLIVRITMNDRQSGDMTTVDAPIFIMFQMTNGKAKVKTSIDAYLNALPSMQPGLPRCASTEIVAAFVDDPAGAQFASAGLFLP